MNPYLPHLARITDRRHEARDVYSLQLRLEDRDVRNAYAFRPGQFNMLYVFGVGEIPISVASDPDEPESLCHTVRAVGHVSRKLVELPKQSQIGLRGPYGSSWPLEDARGKDVIIVTGGLGCAPAISTIDYILRRHENYGTLKILHGVKTPKDLVYRQRFQSWARFPRTEVYLTSDEPNAKWQHPVGMVTELFRSVKFNVDNSIVMMCGPERMMRNAGGVLLERGIPADRIYVAMERNMKCALGFCGHCQLGAEFVCKDGPVFRYDRIQRLLAINEA